MSHIDNANLVMSETKSTLTFLVTYDVHFLPGDSNPGLFWFENVVLVRGSKLETVAPPFKQPIVPPPSTAEGATTMHREHTWVLPQPSPYWADEEIYALIEILLGPPFTSKSRTNSQILPGHWRNAPFKAAADLFERLSRLFSLR